ncbi:MAG: ribonuclease H family protein [Lachnospiraceae bacterium]|nr:ribonuclease H family protein [Lachnospiraceae bacterium]
MATKYYAVRAGRSTGVFLTWAECQKQVTGFPGAVFKSFTTIEEAENFVKGIVPQIEESGEQILKAEPGALVAYVDGSYNVANNQFSYGIVLLDGEQELKFQQFFIDEELASMRNVAGEIKGAEAAMRYAVEQGFQKLYIYHDYEGIAKWCLGEWKTNKEGTKAYKAYFDSIRDKLQVVFVKVAAHTGDKYNEMADKLAKEALGIS